MHQAIDNAGILLRVFCVDISLLRTKCRAGMQANIQRWSHKAIAFRLRPISMHHICPAISYSSSMQQQQACRDMSALWQQVVAVYDQAQQTGAATKIETKLEECEDGGIKFVLRVASALKSKPKGMSGSKDPSASGGSSGHLWSHHCLQMARNTCPIQL